ncbi:MAG: hypothetical protein ACI4UB_00695 [Limosilactobacillus sp.]
MKQSIVVDIDTNFFDKDDINELPASSAIDIRIKNLGNGTPQEFVIASVVVATLSNVAIGLLSSAAYDVLKYLFKRVIDRTKEKIPNAEKRRLEISTDKGAKITLVYDGDATDSELANATRSVTELSKDNYIVLLDKEHGIRILNYVQFAQLKRANKI